MCRVTHTNLSKSCNTVGHMTFTEKQLPHSLMWYCIKFVKRGTVPSFVQIKFNQNQFLHMQLSKWFGSYKSLPSTSFSSKKLKLCLKIWNCVYRPGTVSTDQKIFRISSYNDTELSHTQQYDLRYNYKLQHRHKVLLSLLTDEREKLHSKIQYKKST